MAGLRVLHFQGKLVITWPFRPEQQHRRLGNVGNGWRQRLSGWAALRRVGDDLAVLGRPQLVHGRQLEVNKIQKLMF